MLKNNSPFKISGRHDSLTHIVGAQRNDMHGQRGQRPQEWGPTRCKY